MSVVEQGAAKADADMGIPEFPVRLRGYDPQQVDIFLKDLSIRVTAERRRAEQADRAAAQMRAELAAFRNQPPPSFEHLGAEAGRVLEQAGVSAKLLVEEARARGQALVEEAEAHVRDLIEQAERQAAELEAEAGQTLAEAGSERERILADAAAAVEEASNRAEHDVRSALQQAREEAERTLHEAVSERTTMQGETARLRQSRDRMLEYLGRIHSDLGELLAEAVQAEAELLVHDDDEAVDDQRAGDEDPAGDAIDDGVADGKRDGATPRAE